LAVLLENLDIHMGVRFGKVIDWKPPIIKRARGASWM
jgi:hypothetical protein